MPVIRTEAETVALLNASMKSEIRPDFDHDVAGAEAGEIDDGAELAGVAAEDGAPAEDQRDQDQRQRRHAGNGKRRPEQQIAPLVLKQLEPVGHQRKVAGFDIGGEVRPRRW